MKLVILCPFSHSISGLQVSNSKDFYLDNMVAYDKTQNNRRHMVVFLVVV